MKLISIWLLSIATLLAATATHAATPLKTQKQKFSYAVGVQISQNFKRQGMDLDTNAVVQAIRDIQGGKNPS